MPKRANRNARHRARVRAQEVQRLATRCKDLAAEVERQEAKVRQLMRQQAMAASMARPRPHKLDTLIELAREVARGWGCAARFEVGGLDGWRLLLDWGGSAFDLLDAATSGGSLLAHRAQNRLASARLKAMRLEWGGEVVAEGPAPSFTPLAQVTTAEDVMLRQERVCVLDFLRRELEKLTTGVVQGLR